MWFVRPKSVTDRQTQIFITYVDEAGKLKKVKPSLESHGELIKV